MMNVIRTRINPYEELANAIVLQAVHDYRRLWNFPKDHHAKYDLIHFFHSQWFAILTKIDPNWLIDVLEEEANAKRQKAN